MKRSHLTIIFSLFGVLGAMGLVLAAPSANQSTRKLIEMLRVSEGHRVRVQAAYSLGSFPVPDSQKALLDALSDPYESVRAAALASLAKVGDAGMLPVLRQKRADISASPIWRSIGSEQQLINEQFYRTMALLEESFPEARAPLDWDVVFGALKVGDLEDPKALLGADAPELMHRYFLRHLHARPGLVVVTRDQPSPSLSKYKIKTFIVVCYLLGFKKSNMGTDVRWHAEVDFALREAKSPVPVVEWRERSTVARPTFVYADDQDAVMKETALEEVFRMASATLAQRMRIFFENDLKVPK